MFCNVFSNVFCNMFCNVFSNVLGIVFCDVLRIRIYVLDYVVRSWLRERKRYFGLLGEYACNFFAFAEVRCTSLA